MAPRVRVDASVALPRHANWTGGALMIAGAAFAIAAGVVAWNIREDAAGVPPNYVARDPVLRAAPVRMYRADRARAFVWFFGNDIGFWGAQQRLAASLARRGVDVVGADPPGPYDTTTVSVGRLNPGEIRAFSVRFSNFDNIENINRYECVASFQR